MTISLDLGPGLHLGTSQARPGNPYMTDPLCTVKCTVWWLSDLVQCTVGRLDLSQTGLGGRVGPGAWQVNDCHTDHGRMAGW